ncbi:MAG: hypothetical protein Q8M31_20060 [Beijerinckiaceae bacterium]|nr:hypothetical protein [Beijerinckiaceae bacterium]
MRIFRQSLLAICLLGPGAALATEQPSQIVPDSEARSGENLTERLDRTDSVIKPPATDDSMLIAPPPDSARTPVIKPGEAPPQQVSPTK